MNFYFNFIFVVYNTNKQKKILEENISLYDCENIIIIIIMFIVIQMGINISWNKIIIIIIIHTFYSNNNSDSITFNWICWFSPHFFFIVIFFLNIIFFSLISKKNIFFFLYILIQVEFSMPCLYVCVCVYYHWLFQ